MSMTRPIWGTPSRVARSDLGLPRMLTSCIGPPLMGTAARGRDGRSRQKLRTSRRHSPGRCESLRRRHGGPGPTTIKLPRLTSICVYATRSRPGTNCAERVGRGTHVDCQRRANWASPPPPWFPGCSHQPWTPSAQFFAPGPQISFSIPMQVDASVYQMPVSAHSPYGASLMQVDERYVQVEPSCMPWLDSALRAEFRHHLCPRSSCPHRSRRSRLLPTHPSHCPPPWCTISPVLVPSSLHRRSRRRHHPPHRTRPRRQQACRVRQAARSTRPSSTRLRGARPDRPRLWPCFSVCAGLDAVRGAGAGAASLAPAVRPATTLMGISGVGVGAVMKMFPNQQLAQFVRSHLVPRSAVRSARIRVSRLAVALVCRSRLSHCSLCTCT
ncbi:hypothetical protein C8Q80DRAFT_679499 [Daedaleopsis nitida]|nr:hypothetical protein C8Q80DRAFT_679499 [Daedaleopsis nitida]